MIPEYPSNSSLNKEKPVEDTRELPPIVNTPNVRVKKRNRLLGFIFAKDFKDIKDGLIEDYVKPKVQDAVNSVFENILDTGREAIQMMIFEDGRRPKRTGNYPYDSASWRNNRSQPNAITRSNKEPAYTDLEDLVFDTKAEGEQLIAWLEEIINRYTNVRVADVYDYLKLSAPYTANNYGWYDLSAARTVRCQEGWCVDFPRPTALPNRR